MKKLNSYETLIYIIDLFTYYLDQLIDVKDVDDEQFLYGEKTAFVECLEVIQYWEGASKNGLDYKIEERYPL